MDFQTIVSAIASVGFPIVCCLVMGWYVKYQTDKQREEVSALNAQHKEEIDKVTEALNNNTLAITRLCDKMGE